MNNEQTDRYNQSVVRDAIEDLMRLEEELRTYAKSGHNVKPGESSVDADLASARIEVVGRRAEIALQRETMERTDTLERDKLKDAEIVREKEATSKRTDRYVTGVGTLVGLLIAFVPPSFAFYQFIVTQAKAEQNKRDIAIVEARKAFISKRLDTYSKATAVASRLLISPRDSKNGDTFKKAQDDYEALYWASLPFVEDGNVREKSEALHKSIKDFAPKDSFTGTKDPRLDLKATVNEFTLAMRVSLFAAYNPDIPLDSLVKAAPGDVGPITIPDPDSSKKGKTQ